MLLNCGVGVLFTFCHKGSVIHLSEVVDVSPAYLDSTTHGASLDFPRETGLILRGVGKAGNPFQTTHPRAPLLALPLLPPLLSLLGPLLPPSAS